MKVKALQDGVMKYYRSEGDVFDWPDDKPLGHPDRKEGVQDLCNDRDAQGKCLHVWVEPVPEDTENRMREVGEGGLAFECPGCGYITQRRTKFCPDCGLSAAVEQEANKAAKARQDAIEGITGKRETLQVKLKKHTRGSGAVDKNAEV